MHRRFDLATLQRIIPVLMGYLTSLVGRRGPRTVVGFRVGDVGEGARVAVGENITWIEAAPPLKALYQLRVDIPDFTDREALLSELQAAAAPALQAKGARVLTLAGPAGVGKSALAIHLAHRLLEQLPDVQLYVNLRTPSGQALAAEDVLAGFLRALGGERGGDASAG